MIPCSADWDLVEAERDALRAKLAALETHYSDLAISFDGVRASVDALNRTCVEGQAREDALLKAVKSLRADIQREEAWRTKAEQERDELEIRLDRLRSALK